MVWTVGIDLGGAFTHLYAVNPRSGVERTAKVLTTPSDRVEGVLGAIEQAELSPDSIELLVHGTSTATNALIERDYPEAAMITTEGFRDVLEIGRMHREHLYRPYQTKPSPLIKRRNRYTLDERVTSTGQITQSIDEAELADIVQDIERKGIRTVVVCFINAYSNDGNERLVAEFINAKAPHIKVVTSADVKPIFREHSRFSTACVRGVLLEVMSDYFASLEHALIKEGFSGQLMILKSNGGMMPVEQAALRTEELVESGPAGGIGYATEISKEMGLTHLIHTDVGGTSFDTSVVENGQGLVTRDYEIEFDIPVAVPMLDIRSVGAGGGSIAWIDQGGSLRVGPQSAGSEPGPACYGRGGLSPTVTDANLVLGRLSSDLSGKFDLDVAAARASIAKLAEPLDLSIETCAEGIIRIATETMAQAVKIVLAARGRDPRDYALVSFGGAGPLHACATSEAFGTESVVVPKFSGVASAYEATRLPLKYDAEEFHFANLTSEALVGIGERFRLLAQSIEELLDAGSSDIVGLVSTYIMRMRYAGQTFEVDVEVDLDSITSADIEAVANAFHEAHEREFGVRSEEFQIEIVALAITSSVLSDQKASPPPADASVDAKPLTHRDVYIGGGWSKTQIYSDEAALHNTEVIGPAILENEHASAFVPPGWIGRLDRRKNLVLERSKS